MVRIHLIRFGNTHQGELLGAPEYTACKTFLSGLHKQIEYYAKQFLALNTEMIFGGLQIIVFCIIFCTPSEV